MTYPEYIRHLLGRSTTAIQALTLSIWVATLLFNPYLQRPWGLVNLILLAALLGAAACTLLVRRFWHWRLSGALYVLLLSWAYQIELRQMGVHGEFWWLPTAVTLCLGINLLFPFTRDYLLALAYTWTIMLSGRALPPAAASDPMLLGLLVAAVSLIGLAMNRTFARSMLITYRLKEDYRRISETDALTGLANRRALMAQLHALAAERGRRGTLQFAMLDIDDFKQVNDRHGHDVGDAVLLALAAELTRLGRGCRVGRLGGEEFGIVLDGMSDTQTDALLQRLLERVRQTRAKGVAFTFSAGVARMHPDGDVSDLLKRADRALYAAKRDGKSRICLDSATGPAPTTAMHGVLDSAAPTADPA
ncbi:GGDEF domain-containing protein [Xanthomonas sp. LMG 12460]|uniref:GGDEF domain-containing protein n=1 Tax=Xanthomonas sp. LMG 12460 TaxID=1591132 RepID=UPI001263ED06|nr:GGDEF domain-containing protein [Xanthomonas sp. LMG 12460]KAB7775755.1 GGDEF domain-containing protein [Xanthomonas sp. LMG 12460]